MKTLEQPKESNLQATIISLFPQEIREFKPGLYPGWFTIPAAALGDFSYLVVGDAMFFTENKNDQVLQVRTPYHVLADSIVHDFKENHIARIVGDDETAAEPGLFWVPGGYSSKKRIKEDWEVEIRKHEKIQNRWFAELVKMADTQFQMTQRHSSVSPLQRLAAERLAIQRPWSVDATGSDKCPFCRVTLPFDAIKCPNCREIVNMEKYQELVAARDESVHKVNGLEGVN